MNGIEYKKEICCIIGHIENEKVLRYIFIIVSNIANEIEVYEECMKDVCGDSSSLSA